MNRVTIYLFAFVLIVSFSCGKTKPASEAPTDCPNAIVQYVNDGYYCNEGLDSLNLCMNMQRPADAFNYPVRPCMNVWKSFATTQEMLDVCQLPCSVLKNISTQGLIQACWEYPFFKNVMAFGSNRPQFYFNNSVDNFNGYREILKRNDAGKLLMERYMLLDRLCPSIRTQFPMFEFFTSQEKFLSNLSANDKMRFAKQAMKNDSIIKKDRNDGIVYTDNRISCILIARIMKSYGYSSFLKEIENNADLDLFIKTGETYFKTREEHDNFLNMILGHAKSFIS
jgi:hypothetical protein